MNVSHGQRSKANQLGCARRPTTIINLGSILLELVYFIGAGKQWWGPCAAAHLDHD